MEIQVYTEHHIGQYTSVVLPDGKTDEDIQWIDVRWTKGRVHFKDETVFEFEEDIHLMYGWEDPMDIQHRKVDEDEWTVSRKDGVWR